MKFGSKTSLEGSALVEFAIILPVIVLLVFGAIEAGWALYIQSAISDAARQGARVAVTENVGTGTITTTVDNMIQADKIPDSQLVVDVNPSGVSLQPRGTPITVTVSIPYSSASILPTPMFLGGITLQAQVTMSKEY